MKGDKAFVCCALLLSTFIAFSNSQLAPTPTAKPSVTPTKPGSPTKPGTPTKPGGATPNQTDPNTLQCSVYNLTLKLLNVTYDENLESSHSAQFLQLRMDFEVAILNTYDGYRPFVGVTTLRFSKAPDGKTLVHFCVEFKENGTHLANLTKALTTGKIGKFKTFQVPAKLEQAACYEAPAPPVCQVPCPSSCAPSCYDSCCNSGYQQNYYLSPPPPVPMPVPMPVPPPPPVCPGACPNTCAPVGCSPACCNTMYNQAPQYPYGKRHEAPKPVQGMKKHHIFHKHHRKH